MLKNIIYLFLMLVILLGLFVFIDSFNIDLEKMDEKRLVKEITIET
jgi:hypothetical protein